MPSAAVLPQPPLDLPHPRIVSALRNACKSSTQRTAFDLAARGFNVFPLPYASKKCTYRWSMMQYTRLPIQRISDVFSGLCNIAVMTGRTSGNLFVIDAETNAAYLYYVRQLRQHHIPVFTVRSGGRKRGGHLYLRCADGEIANIPPGTLKDTEIRGNSCYVVAPESLHPNTGKRYTWDIRESGAPPVVRLADIAWLGVMLRKPAKRDLPSPVQYDDLSARNRDFILNGAAVGERNDRLFAAACDLHGNAYPYSQSVTILLSAARGCGLSRHEAHATIASAYNQPRQPAKPFARREKRLPDWRLAWRWANARMWEGTAGTSDRMVFSACCQRAKTANEQGVFRASVRELAELVACDKDTVSRSLRRLVNAGFLLRCGNDRVSGAGLFRLAAETTRGALQNTDTSNVPCGEKDTVPTMQTVLASDAAERRALGKSASLLYAAMLAANQPMTRKQCAAAACLSYSQVYRGLQRLARFGLVTEREGVFCAIAKTAAELNEQVARPAGTLGRGEQRRRRHRFARMMRALNVFLNARGKKVIRC